MDAGARPIHDDNFIILFNVHHERIEFKLPTLRGNRVKRTPDCRQECVSQSMLDTRDHQDLTDGYHAGDRCYPLDGRTLALLRKCETRSVAAND